MRVTANGKALDVADGTTLAELVDDLGLGERWVVVERNGEAVHRSELASVTLDEGDVLEVVRPVQGG